MLNYAAKVRGEGRKEVKGEGKENSGQSKCGKRSRPFAPDL